MTITNGYCTLQQFVDELDAPSAGSTAADTTVMEQCIEDASRDIDGYCGRRFFTAADTVYLDYPDPYDTALWFSDDINAVYSLTNGDGASIASTGYVLWPRNALAKAAIVATGTTTWAASPTGETIGVISASANVGYVNRAASVGSIASNAKSIQVINSTRRACLKLAAAYYRQRKPGAGGEAAQVTAAGVVLVPQGMPKDVTQILAPYVRYW